MVDVYRNHGLPSPIIVDAELKKLRDQHRDCVDLSVMVDQIPPEGVRRVASEAALRGGYDKNLFSLRQAIASYYKTQHGATYDPAREMILTSGGQPAIDTALKILVDRGDTVVLADPEYATFEPIISMYGGNVVPVPLRLEENQWGFDLDAFEAAITTHQPKLVVLSNCQNPTGYVYRQDVLERIAEIVARHDCWVLNDEIWSFLVLADDLRFRSLTSFEKLHERLVTVFSLSKTFGMSGYRIGAMIGPAGLIEEAAEVLRLSAMAVPTIGQHAAIEALNTEKYGPWIEERKQVLRQRTQDAARKLNACGNVSCTAPESGCFLFLNISVLGLSSYEFTVKALQEAGVFVLPGFFYGSHSDGYVRISCSVEESDFHRGVDRLVTFLQSYA